VQLEVVPLQTSVQGRHFLVLFTDVPVAPAALKDKRGKPAEERQIEQLKQELVATRHYLQSIIEEQEATNEELQSANEEILSSNEELQSINEELETAKEELQSTNEELTTVNEELQNRNTGLSLTNDDLNNLLASVNIAIVMLGSDLRIRRFTPMASRILNLIPSDIGRPITDLRPGIKVADLGELIREVVDSASVKECEVADGDDRWYSMAIRPYRTSDGRTDGAVIVLVGTHGPPGVSRRIAPAT
jgi:two-component system CheB/CheR fusion protein